MRSPVRVRSRPPPFLPGKGGYMATNASTTESASDRYGSTILGFIVVLVLGIFLFNIFRGDSKKDGDTGTVGDSGETITDGASPDGQKRYTVKAGETLWDISVQQYGTGYNWSDIAQANNLTNADKITEGQTIIIPNVTPVFPTNVAGTTDISAEPTTTIAPSVNPATEAEPQTPSSSTYTVKAGDSLWNIAVREYNDGYQWVRIARANTLTNTDIIHAGNVLTLPR